MGDSQTPHEIARPRILSKCTVNNLVASKQKMHWRNRRIHRRFSATRKPVLGGYQPFQTFKDEPEQSQPENHAMDVELTRFKLALNREVRSMAPEQYIQQFEKFSMERGLTFLIDKYILSTNLRKKQLYTLHLDEPESPKWQPKLKSFDDKTKSKTA